MLIVKNLHVAYGQSEALHGIDLSAKKNETVAIMGRNGMGKTTLFKSLIGILPLKSGHIEVAGKEVSKDESYMRVAKGIAYVPQGRMIFPTLTVEENIHTGLENAKVKKVVLAEVEDLVREDTIIASNTSTISISLLAESLKRPQNFVGMHFFNPVNMMPLVEVIRGKQSSEDAVAATVKLAGRMGKTPVVVNDCPGFFVNRVLFPYFAGFHMLLRDGADFQAVDKAMEKFGWPMGPAYLMDVVGMDTAVHAAAVMAEGFPDRMSHDWKNTTQLLVANQRYGQKNGKGYYVYAPDKKGKPQKSVDPATYELIKDVVAPRKEFTPEEIVARCMVPMFNEVARCLEEKIVASPHEADMSLLYGIGFPPFRGGACRYIDQTGVASFLATADKLASLGKLYEAPKLLRDMAASGKKFFG